MAIFGGTTEQRCKCKKCGVGWSASGACSFGTGKPTAKKSVKSHADCAKQSMRFRGNQACANACTSVVGKSSSTSRRRSLVQLDSEDEALADDEEV